MGLSDSTASCSLKQIILLHSMSVASPLSPDGESWNSPGGRRCCWTGLCLLLLLLQTSLLPVDVGALSDLWELLLW